MAQQVSHVINGWWEVRNDGNELNLLVATTSLLILVSLLWFKFRLSHSSKGAPPLPPGPRSFPIIGYLPFLTPDLHKQLTTMAHSYGPIFKFKLGSKLHVVINTPELVKEVVRDQDEAFSNRDQTAAALALTYGGQNIGFSDNNVNWRKLRKIFVHEILSNTNLKASYSFRRDEVRKTIKDLFGRLRTAVDVREIAFFTETNVLTRMMWENTAIKKNIAAEIEMVISDLSECFGRVNLSDFFPSLARYDLQGVERGVKTHIKKLDKLFASIIEDRIESNFKRPEDHEGERKDFVQVLLHLKDENDVTLSMTQMKALLLDVMLGGIETTSTTVEWAMASIMNDDKIMKKIQEELAENVGLNNKVEESHLSKLKYLEATIKETLRLYPALPFLIPRSPSKTCTVGGYTIPMGCTIFLNVWSIHRDARYWDNPLKFNPERFLTDKLDYKGNSLKYFPFGSGRRSCAGIPLAEKMLMFILASFLHSFDWSLPEGEDHDLNEICTIAIKKRKPLIAIPSQRLSDVSLYM